MNKIKQSSNGKFHLLANNLGIYALKMVDENSFWMEQSEIEELREFLNSLTLPERDKSLDV